MTTNAAGSPGAAPAAGAGWIRGGQGRGAVDSGTHRSLARRQAVPVLSRIFVWSLVLEPLNFFVLFDRTTAGITGNVSRLLQVAVILVLVARFLSGWKGRSAWPRLRALRSPLYVNYTRYFVIAVVAGAVGLVSGAYSMPSGYAANTYESGFSRVVNSASVRPLVEYVVTAYYFFFFVMLPPRLLRTPRAVQYFFTTFRSLFIASFVIGVVDFGFSMMGITLIPRHIADVWHRWLSVGPRFHGLAGEPRQAFVYLFCGLAVLYVDSVRRGRPLPKWWMFAIVLAALATQSASGMVGIVCFVGLLAAWTLSRLSIGGMLRVIGIVTLSVALLWAAATRTERIVVYVESLSDLWIALEVGEPLPGAIAMQQFDIYPLYDLTVKARSWEVVPLLVGSGLGSSSMVNNRYMHGEKEFGNPSSQVVRILYETGVLGLLFFVLAFLWPIVILTRRLPARTRRNFVVMTLLAVGVCLGLRNSMVFIYVGATIAMFTVRHRVALAARSVAGSSEPRTEGLSPQ